MSQAWLQQSTPDLNFQSTVFWYPASLRNTELKLDMWTQASPPPLFILVLLFELYENLEFSSSKSLFHYTEDLSKRDR